MRPEQDRGWAEWLRRFVAAGRHTARAQATLGWRCGVLGGLVLSVLLVRNTLPTDHAPHPMSARVPPAQCSPGSGQDVVEVTHLIHMADTLSACHDSVAR